MSMGEDRQDSAATTRPILFSDAMVLALLREARWPGTGKTQTRRLAAQSPLVLATPGDRLWVRETWASPTSLDPGPTFFRADYPACVPAHFERVPPASAVRWRPSIYMRREASRLTLVVLEVRRQRLHEMTDKDAEAEGVEWESADPPFFYVPGIHPHSITAVETREGARACFAKLWNHLHGPGSWDTNPEVVALTFRPALRNIDHA